MCSRVSRYFDSSEVEDYYDINKVNKEFKSKINVSPSQDLPLIIYGSKILDMAKWGLIPSWAKSEDIGTKLINARAETVDEKPSFRNSFKSRRCVILVSGFFEWNNKAPFYVKVKGRQIIPLAGLYSIWKNKNGKEKMTCCIITTKANKQLATIHDRMPVILDDNQIDFWNNPTNTEYKRLKLMLKPLDYTDLESYPVTRLVNNPKYNHKNSIEKVKITLDNFD